MELSDFDNIRTAGKQSVTSHDVVTILMWPPGSPCCWSPRRGCAAGRGCSPCSSGCPCCSPSVASPGQTASPRHGPWGKAVQILSNYIYNQHNLRELILPAGPHQLPHHPLHHGALPRPLGVGVAVTSAAGQQLEPRPVVAGHLNNRSPKYQVSAMQCPVSPYRGCPPPRQ